MRIGIAKDEAFNFMYVALVDALRERNEVLYFSPLRDERMPECDCLYLPGGYPELFARELEANAGMRQSIKDYAEGGGAIYAECGGFMYLTRSIDGIAMCGVLPLEATMTGARLHLGYRQMAAESLDCPLMRAMGCMMDKGEMIRGHEFHYSTIKEWDALPGEVTVTRGQRSARGAVVDTPVFRYKNVVAGYTHWYFAAKKC